MATQTIQLVDPCVELEKTFWDFRNAFDTPPNQVEMKKLEAHGFAYFIDLLIKARTTPNEELGLVPHSVYWLINDERKMIGSIDFRHQLTPKLEIFGGHIGYAVHPDYRRRGYATYMLKQMFPVAKQKGISRLLVTCDVDNLASQGVIKKCTGVYENTVTIDDHPSPLKRYWINLSHF